MQETLYKLIFEGNIQPGHKEKTVRQSLKALFKADKAKMERLFSGAPMIIRKNLTEEKIRPYEKAMVKAGAVCRIIAVKGGLELPPTNFQALTAVGDDEPLAATPEEKPVKKERSFHWSNRLGRTRFLALLWVAGWLEVLAWLLPEYLPRLVGALTIQERLMIASGLHTLAGLSFIAIIGLRLHDIDRSAWLWVFMLIPGLNLLFMFWITFARGSQSWNTYGQIPSQPGNLARLFGFWIPLLIVLSTGGSAWFHQEELLQLASNLPEEIMQLPEF